MEGFSIVDIFDTKGIEYLIVIGFLLLIVPVWTLLNRPVQMKTELVRSLEGFSRKLLNFPKGIFYNRNHTWSFMEKSGVAKVGVDEFLLHVTGGVSVDFLRTEGQEISKGDLLACISNGDRKMKITSPVSGKIRKVNSSLTKNEGSINSDPYGKSWISKIEPANWRTETTNSMQAEEAEKWTDEELVKVKDFMSKVSASESESLILQEGGVLVDFPLADMPGDVWETFQREFLD